MVGREKIEEHKSQKTKNTSCRRKGRRYRSARKRDTRYGRNSLEVSGITIYTDRQPDLLVAISRYVRAELKTDWEMEGKVRAQRKKEKSKSFPSAIGAGTV